MPTEVKWVFTVFVAIVCLILAFTRIQIAPSRPSFWRGGKNDLFRRALFRKDGGERKYARHVLAAWICVFTAIIWLIPSQ